MNILMVYPRYPDTFWSFRYALKFVSKKSVFPPLGLLTVASLLPKGWNKKVVDLNVRNLKDEDILWADYVFVSAMMVQEKSAKEIIDRVKILGKTVVAGGPAFTTGFDRFENVDYFVLNEAEITLPLFLKDLEEGNLKKIYTSTERPDITKTPIPSWNLINFKDYLTMPVQYSRGCPYNCEFCDIIIMNGRIPRTKTKEQMINEFQILYDLGWRDSVFVVDDNFIGNKENVKKLLPYLVRWQKKHKYPFKLFTEASVNLSDDKELMKLMSMANFNKVFLGIETPNPESLRECDKMLNVNKDLVESVKTIQRNGMQVMGGFIVGFDNDNETIFDSQIKFIQQIGVATAMVGLLTAMPQTRLWHRLKKEGRLVKRSTGENTDGSLNFIPKMGKEKLINGYKQIIKTIYNNKNYYKRVWTFIKNYKPTVKSKIRIADIGSFLKSIWFIGILSKARFYYWKLLIKTGIIKPKAFSIAVELAIEGSHYEKVARRVLSVN
ncbi:MAG: B12-binding domain-containing radical SAM protein [Candidatus Nanoarchaeia archaeon]|nr:B12-binding domain-containing radical SAM protein [Candidatus Nanoarchaeia archaeon]